MDSFLDTCIILDYFNNECSTYLITKKLIDLKSNLIISIYQEKIEIPFLLFRKDKIISEAIKLSAYSAHIPNLDKLTPKDKINLNKTIAKLKIGELSQQDLFELKKEVQLLKQKINYFIRNQISRKVILLEKIDIEVVKKIKDKIHNEADSNILSSAIQEHQQNKLIIITNDKKDWKKEILVEVLKNTSYLEIPEIKYLI